MAGDAPFWGPFAELRERLDGVVDVVDLYDGPVTELYTDVFALRDDIPGYLELARSCGGRVLELGCGTGRVLLALAREGHEVVGVDPSATALTHLSTLLEAEPAGTRDRVTLVEGDATRLSLGETFPLVILGGLTWTLFDDAVAQAVLERAALHLAPGGVFVFDYPVFHWEAADSWDSQVISLTLPYDGGEATCLIGARSGDERSHLVTNSYWCLPGPDGGVRHYLEAKRVAVVDEPALDATLARHGLTVRARHAAPLEEGVCDRHVVECVLDARRAYPLWHPYTPGSVPPEAFTMLRGGDGTRVRDASGTEYVDMAGGLWSTQCGLGHPRIVEAVAAQIQRLSYGTLFAGRSNEPALLLARRLAALAPAELPWVYLTGSGSESVELGLKIARLHGRLRGEDERTEILYLDHAYHGSFFGSMSVSGVLEEAGAVGPLLPGTAAVPAPVPWLRPADRSDEDFVGECVAALEEALVERSGRVAGFILEPVLGSAGVVPLPAAYVHEARRLCREHGALLLVDEVATGFGRTGRWFACEHWGLEPDVLMLGKGINSGYLPLGAVLFSEEVAGVLRQSPTGLIHGSSHNGNPVCCAAALATIDVLEEEELVARAARVGDLFRRKLEALLELPAAGAVRGVGLMLGLELRQEDGSRATPLQAATVNAALQRTGVLAYPESAGLVFMPALTVGEPEIDTTVAALQGILSGMRLRDGEVHGAAQP